MGELNMRLQILQHTSERLLRNVAIVLIAGFGAGCSADTMRFTDGISTGSTSSQRVAQQPTGDLYASAAPVAPASSGSVQRNSLPPVTSAPMAAPVAAARQSVQAPVAAASIQNQVGQVQDMAANRVNNTVNAAETKVASAATSTRNTVNGAQEKVLDSFRRTQPCHDQRTTISQSYRRHLPSTARSLRQTIWLLRAQMQRRRQRRTVHTR